MADKVNLNPFTNSAFTADENNYVTDAEWNQIKNKTVQYLMGMMLSGKRNTNILSGLNSKYKTDQNYKAALSAINQLIMKLTFKDISTMQLMILYPCLHKMYTEKINTGITQLIRIIEHLFLQEEVELIKVGTCIM